MRSTQQLSITLPKEMVTVIKARVQSGDYASESEVLREGIRALLEKERVVDDWLRQNVASTYDAMKADPGRAVSIEAVKARLAAEHEKNK